MVNYLNITPPEFQRTISDEAFKAYRWYEKKLPWRKDQWKCSDHDKPLALKSRELGKPVFDLDIPYNPTTTGNHWHVLRIIRDQNHISIDRYTEFVHIIGITENAGSFRVYYVILELDRSIPCFICVFPVHFWTRYKTRSKTTLTGEEMVLDFFKREIDISYYMVDLFNPQIKRKNKKYRNVCFDFEVGQGRGVCISQSSRIYECRTFLGEDDLPPLEKYKARWQRKYMDMKENKSRKLRLEYGDDYLDDSHNEEIIRALGRDFELNRAFYRSCGENAKHSDTMANMCVLYNIIEDSLPHKKEKMFRDSVFRNQHQLLRRFAHSHGQCKNISLDSDDVYRFMVEAAEMAKNELNIYEVCIFLDAFNKAADGKYGNLEELANLAKQVTDDAREHPERYPVTWRRAEERVKKVNSE